MTLKRLLLQLRLAASFLTIVPVSIAGADEADVAASMAWFPAIGWLMGDLLAQEDWLLGFVFGPTIRSAIVVLSIAVLSGAMHLDGLSDTADALSAGGNRDRALEILRDSRIGVFGAVALFFALSLKVFALASLPSAPRFVSLIIAPMLARWAMVTVSYRLDYLRANGAGSAMLGRFDNRNLAIASATALLPLVVLHERHALSVYAVAVIATLSLRWFYRRWLGGVTGDLIGACGEIVEVMVMLTMAAR